MNTTTNDPLTPTARAIQDWYATLLAAKDAGVAPHQGVFIEPMPPLVAAARAEDFRAADWTVDAEGSEALDEYHWCGRAYFSPGQRHAALMFAGNTEWNGGSVLWIDGAAVPIPRDEADQSSRLDQTGEWVNERYFVVAEGGFYDHPRFTFKITIFGLGNIYGLWIYDAQTRTARSELPTDEECWEGPVARMIDGQLAIYATGQDRRDGRVARWVRL